MDDMTEDELRFQAWLENATRRHQTTLKNQSLLGASLARETAKPAIIFHETILERIFGGFDQRMRRTLAQAS